MTAKQFELEVLNNNKYVIAEFDKDNYYLDDENSVKSLECRLNELFKENEQLKSFNQDLSENLSVCANKRLSQGEHLTKLNNENEQLKSDLRYWRTLAQSLAKGNNIGKFQR